MNDELLNENEVIETDDEKPDVDVIDIIEEKPPFCTVGESIFAIIFCFLGYFFIELFLKNSCGIAASVFLEAVLMLSLIMAKLRKAEKSRYSLAYLIISAVFSLGLGISADGYIQFMDFCFAVMFYSLWGYSLNSPEWQGLGRMPFRCIKKAAVKEPFGNFSACPKAVFSVFRHKSGAKNIGYAVVGLMLSIPLTVIVCILLISADDGFDKMLGNIIDSISLVGFWTFMFGLPVSFWIFGIVYSAVSSKGKLRVDYNGIEEEKKRKQVAPTALVCSFAAPLCIIYVMFFFSQLGYFVSAFGGTVPEGFSTSEYARKGFFELCAVAVINLLVIAAMNVYCRRTDGKNTALKLMTVIFSFFTLILIATAESKMFLYISRFGLTPKRVYTSWFMLILAVIFILIIVSSFVKIPAERIAAVFIIGAALLLGFCGADGLIARYDAGLIESGVMTEFPYDLSADAASYIKKCLKSDNEQVRAAAESSLYQMFGKVSAQNGFERSVTEMFILQ